MLSASARIFLFLVILGGHTAFAGILPPIRSLVCEARLFLSHQGPVSSEETEAALQRFSRFRGQVLDAERDGDTLFSSTHAAGRGPQNNEAVAARIRGMSSSGDGRASVIRTGRIISGKEAIEEFISAQELRLEALHRFSLTGQETFEIKFLGVFAAILGWRLYEWLNIPAIVYPLLTIGLPLFAGGSYILRLDHHLQRPFFWDWGFARRANKFRQALDAIAKGDKSSWHFEAQSVKMVKDLVDAARVSSAEPMFWNVYWQATMEGLARVQKASMERLGQEVPMVWVGVDMLLQANADGEPELVLLARSSPQTPAAEKSAQRREAGVGVLKTSPAGF